MPQSDPPDPDATPETATPGDERRYVFRDGQWVPLDFLAASRLLERHGIMSRFEAGNWGYASPRMRYLPDLGSEWVSLSPRYSRWRMEQEMKRIIEQAASPVGQAASLYVDQLRREIERAARDAVRRAEFESRREASWHDAPPAPEPAPPAGAEPSPAKRKRLRSYTTPQKPRPAPPPAKRGRPPKKRRGPLPRSAAEKRAIKAERRSQERAALITEAAEKIRAAGVCIDRKRIAAEIGIGRRTLYTWFRDSRLKDLVADFCREPCA